MCRLYFWRRRPKNQERRFGWNHSLRVHAMGT